MQEEVENRTCNLAISTTKLTARTVISAGKKVLQGIKDHANETPAGKQSIKDLVGQNAGVTDIDISKTDLKGFEKYARKYGVDYAITKDNSVTPPKYMVFFKARDSDAINAAFNEYSEKALNRSENEKPSVLEQLKELKEKVAAIPSKVRMKHREQEL